MTFMTFMATTLVYVFVNSIKPNVKDDGFIKFLLSLDPISWSVLTLGNSYLKHGTRGKPQNRNT